MIVSDTHLFHETIYVFFREAHNYIYLPNSFLGPVTSQ
jgi:hypothetical protein